MAEKKADSGYFINPQWPYLLAREAEQTLPPEDAKLLDKAPEVLPLKKQLAGKWNLKSNTGRRTTITFKEDGTFVEAQMGVDIANGEWEKIGNSLKVKKKDWTDVYELPIQDGKLKGRSQQGNFLDLSKLPDQ
jgi:hypothetical protein